MLLRDTLDHELEEGMAVSLGVGLRKYAQGCEYVGSACRGKLGVQQCGERDTRP